MAKKTGQAPPSINCPSDLEAKIGESENCTLTDNEGLVYATTVTIESISEDGDSAGYHVQVGDQPESVSASAIESGASKALAESVGRAPPPIDCPHDLDAKVGASEKCTLTDNQGDKYATTVTIERVSKDGVDYHVQVADRPE